MSDLYSMARLVHRYYYWRRAKCVYIHVPKAAGTSINHALYGRTLGHFSISEIRARFPALVEKSCVFSVVRNPYSRVVSAYNFARSGRTSDMGMSNPAQYKIPEFESLERFVLEWLPRQNLEKADFVFRPQHQFVCIEGRVALDVLCRLETLDTDILEVEQRLGRTLNIGRRNVSGGKDSDSWESLLNREMRARVYNLYQQDFEQLGYPEQADGP